MLAWAKLLDEEPSLLNMSPLPHANDESVRKHKTLGDLFDATPVPDSLEGFELKDSETISEVWPEGTDHAKEVRLLSFALCHDSLADNRSCLNAFYTPNHDRSSSSSSLPYLKVQRKTRRRLESKST